jgi:hypothetical protein
MESDGSTEGATIAGNFLMGKKLVLMEKNPNLMEKKPKFNGNKFLMGKK